MLTVVHDAQEANDDACNRRSLLDEIVRDGARPMLAAALRAEVAAYVEQFADQLDEDGRRLVVRNWYHHGREVLTAAGGVTVRAPRVNDRRVDRDTGERQRFSSAILPAWARKSPQISEVLPLLYLHGLSTGDFGPALEQFLGSGAGLSAESWADLLRDCRRRGMTAPVLAVGDGALGFWKAVREVFPATREQRCWFHKQANVLAALPKSAHPAALAALKDIYNAEDIDKAQVAVKAFEVDYGAKYPKAVAKITGDLDTLLEFYKYPAEHWIHLRTTNPIVIHLRHRSFKDESDQGAGVPGGRYCHGLQADRRRTGPLAGGQRPAPGRPGPRRRDLPQRKTPRTAHRHHPARTHHRGAVRRIGRRLTHPFRDDNSSGQPNPGPAVNSVNQFENR